MNYPNIRYYIQILDIQILDKASNPILAQLGLTLIHPDVTTCHILMSTLLFPDLTGGENDHTYSIVSSPGMLLQGQEGYQTCRFNNAGIVKFTKRKFL